MNEFIYNFIYDFNRILNIFFRFYLTYAGYASHFIFGTLFDIFSVLNYISLLGSNYFLLLYLIFIILTRYFAIYNFNFLKNFLYFRYIMIFHYRSSTLLG
ncbi:hypothetical protein MCM1_2066 [Methanosarcina barkeri CM1]|uniref:Uncharacterized protein n=1 Tax=Methanosarcina barkeri CM1 TaxID=796385 RepID=A0A0G3CEA1_METBA|nr:hypothetical protein MCM1_2066 [Methanosarcina barkeri CM1]